VVLTACLSLLSFGILEYWFLETAPRNPVFGAIHAIKWHGTTVYLTDAQQLTATSYLGSPVLLLVALGLNLGSNVFPKRTTSGPTWRALSGPFKAACPGKVCPSVPNGYPPSQCRYRSPWRSSRTIACDLLASARLEPLSTCLLDRPDLLTDQCQPSHVTRNSSIMFLGRPVLSADLQTLRRLRRCGLNPGFRDGRARWAPVALINAVVMLPGSASVIEVDR